MSSSPGADSVTTLAEATADPVLTGGLESKPHVVAVCGTRSIPRKLSWIVQLPRRVTVFILDSAERRRMA
jgi:hypothetical protein